MSQKIKYIIIIVTSIILGLTLRYFVENLPRWVNLYAGDFLWAFMIFFIFAFIFNKKKTLEIIVMSLAYSYLIELSQLYQAVWINAIRQTTIGHLLLGRGFLWSDLISYTIGVLAAGFLEFNFFKSK